MFYCSIICAVLSFVAAVAIPRIFAVVVVVALSVKPRGPSKSTSFLQTELSESLAKGQEQRSHVKTLDACFLGQPWTLQRCGRPRLQLVLADASDEDDSEGGDDEPTTAKLVLLRSALSLSV